MKVSSFWIILIRISGLYFLFQLIFGVLFVITSGLGMVDRGEAIYTLIFSLIFSGGLFMLVLRYLILHPNLLIQRFNLTSHFEEESFQISRDKTSLIQIAIIVLGGLYLLDAIPAFLRTVVALMQMDQFFNESPLLPDIIQNFVLIVLGFLLMSRSRAIAKWIEDKSVIHSDTLDRNQK